MGKLHGISKQREHLHATINKEGNEVEVPISYIHYSVESAALNCRLSDRPQSSAMDIYVPNAPASDPGDSSV